MEQERLKQLIKYDPESGSLNWVKPHGRATTAAAGTLDNRGYRVLCIDRQRYAATRLICLYMTGELPSKPMSFIDGDPANLRWGNLEHRATTVQPTADNIRSLFDYDPETGALTRKQTTGGRAKKGAPAGTYNNGYLIVNIGGVMHKGHRLIWLYMTGNWPTYEIDHKDGDPGNNRWLNLREATSSQNKCNRSYHNKTGFRGVHKRRDGYYAAEVCKDGQRHRLGLFKTAELAGAAAASLRDQLHGDFARP